MAQNKLTNKAVKFKRQTTQNIKGRNRGRYETKKEEEWMTSCDGVGSSKPPVTWWYVTGDLGADFNNN